MSWHSALGALSWPRCGRSPATILNYRLSPPLSLQPVLGPWAGPASETTTTLCSLCLVLEGLLISPHQELTSCLVLRPSIFDPAEREKNNSRLLALGPLLGMQVGCLSLFLWPESIQQFYLGRSRSQSRKIYVSKKILIVGKTKKGEEWAWEVSLAVVNCSKRQ